MPARRPETPQLAHFPGRESQNPSSVTSRIVREICGLRPENSFVHTSRQHHIPADRGVEQRCVAGCGPGGLGTVHVRQKLNHRGCRFDRAVEIHSVEPGSDRTDGRAALCSHSHSTKLRTAVFRHIHSGEDVEVRKRLLRGTVLGAARTYRLTRVALGQSPSMTTALNPRWSTKRRAQFGPRLINLFGSVRCLADQNKGRRFGQARCFRRSPTWCLSTVGRAFAPRPISASYTLDLIRMPPVQVADDRTSRFRGCRAKRQLRVGQMGQVQSVIGNRPTAPRLGASPPCSSLAS